jgi:chorismate synthase
VKYGGYQDVAGGEHFSGRLTAPLCVAGGLCKQWLELEGIRIGAHVASIATSCDERFDPLQPQLDQVSTVFPVLNETAGQQMRSQIYDAKLQGDSVGGVIECAVTGLPAGIGDPMFGGMESRIAAIVYGIPAVKAVEFGSGSAITRLRGSVANDAYTVVGGHIRTATNHAGGILGGITNGMPIVFRAAIKPTPSIAKEQQSVSLVRGEEIILQVQGRHDPCIVPRAVPVIEAAAAIAVYDAILARRREIGR